MYKMHLRVVITFLMCLVFANQNLYAADLASGVWNGQKYRVVSFPGQSWDAANAQINGSCEHLATLTSVEEDNFMITLLEDNGVNGAYYLGAFQSNPSDPPADGWQWVTGEAWSYTNWGPDEPNDYDRPESYLAIWNLESYQGWKWNDEGNDFNVSGYIVESGLDAIDIKPGSDPNSINCANENGVITVALLTTDCFDASSVDHASITFEGARETHVDKKTGEPRQHMEDVDGDGDLDAVFHFRFADTDLDCESTSAVLMGMTADGILVYGQDNVRMVSTLVKNAQDFSNSTNSNIINEYALQGNYPNPFNPQTEIQFDIPESGIITLTVFNALGMKVRKLIQGNYQSGSHSIRWDALDDSGNRVPSGIYFVQLQANHFSQVRKMTLLK